MAFELSLEKLVYGGEALGHFAGETVLVSGALASERAEVEIVRRAKGVVHARLVRVLQAAAGRIEAPCPYFGQCGGCQYQHLRDEEEIAAKREILRETLRRIGKIDWPGDISVHAGHPWNYRNRAEFKLGPSGEARTSVGFFETQSHRLVPVQECVILSPRLNEVLKTLRTPEWAARLEGCREVEAFADHEDERVMLTFRGALERQGAERLGKEALSCLPGAVSVAIDCGGEPLVYGAPNLEYRVGEFAYQVSPGSFFQASRFLLPALVQCVAGNSVPEGALALDLYAGVGLFSLPLARRFTQVVAVEGHPAAARDLSSNVAKYNLANVRAVAASTQEFLRRFAQTAPDFVILDPPRAGLGAPELKLLLGLAPRSVVYVSCHPPALARDLAAFFRRGYRLDALDLFDSFPQTYHFEVVARLSQAARRQM